MTHWLSGHSSSHLPSLNRQLLSDVVYYILIFYIILRINGFHIIWRSDIINCRCIILSFLILALSNINSNLISNYIIRTRPFSITQPMSAPQHLSSGDRVRHNRSVRYSPDASDLERDAPRISKAIDKNRGLTSETLLYYNRSRRYYYFSSQHSLIDRPNREFLNYYSFLSLFDWLSRVLYCSARRGLFHCYGIIVCCCYHPHHQQCGHNSRCPRGHQQRHNNSHCDWPTTGNALQRWKILWWLWLFNGSRVIVVGNYILHKLLADWTDLFAQRGGEHHHLFAVRRVPEDLLHVTTHVYKDKNKFEVSFIIITDKEILTR